MDSSTAVFVATLVIAFIFLRWFIAPVPATAGASALGPRKSRTRAGVKTKAKVKARESLSDASDGESTADEVDIRTPINDQSHREVSSSMVEVVQALAPLLTEAQIRHDLERNGGSVSQTVDKFMATGDLPHPPVSKTAKPLVQEQVTTGWSDNKEERSLLLQKKREEMMEKARRRLAAQLRGEGL